jgi:broad specificity phosphatase PhoE
MPTRLLLIAHGATAATRRAAFPLDEPIEAAAHELANAIAPNLMPAHRHYTAPERRCRETAEALGLAAEPQTLLADLDLGRWRGKSFDAMLEEGPQAIAAWTSDPASRVHGGESVDELLARVKPWLERQREEGGKVIAVTHPAVLRAAVTLIIGAPSSSFWRIDIGPLAQVELRGDDRRWTLRGIAGPS